MTTGDVNALDYGGGIVYQDRYGIHWVVWDTDDEETDRREVYTVDVDDDVAAAHTWVNWQGVASSIGMGVDELLCLARSSKLSDRVEALDAAMAHHGKNEFDQYPRVMTRAELKHDWPRQLR